MELKRRQPILAGHQNFLFGDGSVSRVLKKPCFLKSTIEIIGVFV